MVDRAVSLCSPKFLQSELNYIRTTFSKNGYPQAFIDKVIQRRLNRRDSSEYENLNIPRLVLPYFVGLGEKILGLGRILVFKVFFKSSSSLRSILRKDKTKVPINKKTGLVYMVKCACSAAYISETSGTLEQRLNEHMKCLKWYNNAKYALQNGAPMTTRGRPLKLNPQVAMEKALQASAVAEHIALCNNSFQAKTLCYESNLRLRKINEALYIRYNTTFNRDLAEDVSMILANLIDTTNCCSFP
ncbi:hypothetical protein M513_12582 [Trichuris suis]|nr:hypothetical protein M513_12582 [Trichuris suis]